MTGCGVWDRAGVRRHPCPAPGRNPAEVIVALHTVEFTVHAGMSLFTVMCHVKNHCFQETALSGPTKMSLFNLLP